MPHRASALTSHWCSRCTESRSLFWRWVYSGSPRVGWRRALWGCGPAPHCTPPAWSPAASAWCRPCAVRRPGASGTGRKPAEGRWARSRPRWKTPLWRRATRPSCTHCFAVCFQQATGSSTRVCREGDPRSGCPGCRWRGALIWTGSARVRTGGPGMETAMKLSTAGTSSRRESRSEAAGREELRGSEQPVRPWSPTGGEESSRSSKYKKTQPAETPRNERIHESLAPQISWEVKRAAERGKKKKKKGVLSEGLWGGWAAGQWSKIGGGMTGGKWAEKCSSALWMSCCCHTVQRGRS